MKKGLFPGSFDPPTLGHLDLIERAATLCEELWVGLAVNSAKKPLLAMSEKQEMLELLTQHFPHVKVVAIKGLVVDFARENGIDFLVRGLRSYADLYHELQLAVMNRELSGIETIFLPGKPQFSHFSSSLIRELGENGVRLDKLVSPLIEEKVIKAIMNLG
jgi:pantetheine-phosphate adenylyltransferase